MTFIFYLFFLRNKVFTKFKNTDYLKRFMSLFKKKRTPTETLPTVKPTEETPPAVKPTEETPPAVKPTEETPPVVKPTEKTPPVVNPVKEDQPKLGPLTEKLRNQLADIFVEYGNYRNRPEISSIKVQGKITLDRVSLNFISKKFLEVWKRIVDPEAIVKISEAELQTLFKFLLDKSTDLSWSILESIELQRIIPALQSYLVKDLNERIFEVIKKTVKDIEGPKFEAQKSQINEKFRLQLDKDFKSLSTKQKQKVTKGIPEDQFLESFQKFTKVDEITFLDNYVSKYTNIYIKENQKGLKHNSEESARVYGYIKRSDIEGFKSALSELDSKPSLADELLQFRVENYKLAWSKTLTNVGDGEAQLPLDFLVDKKLIIPKIDLELVKRSTESIIIDDKSSAGAELVYKAFGLKKTPFQVYEEFMKTTWPSRADMMKEIDILLKENKKLMSSEDYDSLKSYTDYDRLVDSIGPEKAEVIYKKYFSDQKIKLAQSLLDDVHKSKFIDKEVYDDLKQVLSEDPSNFLRAYNEYEVYESMEKQVVEFYQKTVELLKPVDNAEDQNTINKAIMNTYKRMKRLADKGMIQSQDENRVAHGGAYGGQRNTGEITMTEDGASEFDDMENGYFQSELETIEEASQRIYTEEILAVTHPAYIKYKNDRSNDVLDLFSDDFISNEFLRQTTGKPEKIAIETKETAKEKFPKYGYGGKSQLTNGDQRFYDFNEMTKSHFDSKLEPPFTGLGPKTFNQLAIQSKEMKSRMPLIYEKLELLETYRKSIKSKFDDMGDLGQYFLEAMEQLKKDLPLVQRDDSQLFDIHKNKT
ncbi:hypothetical protein BY996DRAFT_7266530 [Phakopsora pachyrhizi]|nr:hypothetical protein BY996DRAFT_7266530 [Phakopsora pachyrhizi]